MSCECPNQQQLCDPVRGLPYNPSGIPFIDEELDDDAHQLHAVIVCNDLRSPEAQGLIRKEPTSGQKPRRTIEKRRRPKTNDTQITLPDRSLQNQTRNRSSGSVRRGFQGLANKVRRNSMADSSDGHAGSSCNRNACQAMLMAVLLSAAYFLLAVIAAVVTYSLISDLLESLRHPVHSVRYKQIDSYEPPGIVIHPGEATFTDCGYYFQEHSDPLRYLTNSDTGNRSCPFFNISYILKGSEEEKSALVIKGPSEVSRRETLFLRFQSDDPQREFFALSYFLFPGWNRFNGSSGELELSNHLSKRRKEPPLALSDGFQFWIKMSIQETLLVSKDTNIDMKAEHTIIKHWDTTRGSNRKSSRVYFLFFEWKNNLVQETYLLCTTSAWQIGACVCAIFLGLHKLYNIVKAGVKKAKRRKQKRKYSSLNSKEQKTDVDDHSCECACSEAADKNHSCDNES